LAGAGEITPRPATGNAGRDAVDDVKPALGCVERRSARGATGDAGYSAACDGNRAPSPRRFCRRGSVAGHI